MDEVMYFSLDLKVSLRGLLVFTAAFTRPFCSPHSTRAQSICAVIKQQSD